jgi:hypothetical protein
MQLAWSLVAAAAIAIVVILLVTAKIGPGLDARELREQQEIVEERREAREERLEERREAEEDALGARR